jgi:F1F0 ATPase subunit 2
MSEVSRSLLALFAGLALGLLFFGGLWWTVRKGLSSQGPGLWFVVSLLLRTSLTVAGFYLVSQGVWLRLCACLVGFSLGRSLVTRLLRAPLDKATQTAGGGAT